MVKENKILVKKIKVSDLEYVIENIPSLVAVVQVLYDQIQGKNNLDLAEMIGELITENYPKFKELVLKYTDLTEEKMKDLDLLELVSLVEEWFSVNKLDFLLKRLKMLTSLEEEQNLTKNRINPIVV